MRSVHTLASVQAHCWGTSPPCLAFGTPGSSNCVCVSFTRSPSCPPWLHGHYPLHRYYEDSDSCPAPSSARQVSLIHEQALPDIPSPTTPCAPAPAMLCVPGRLGPPIRLAGYRRFFGLRSLVAVSSVASGRIEFVSQPAIGPQLYGLSVHFQLLSTPPHGDAVTFSCWRLAPPERDSHPPMHAHSQAHDCASPLALFLQDGGGRANPPVVIRGTDLTPHGSRPPKRRRTAAVQNAKHSRSISEGSIAFWQAAQRTNVRQII